MKIQKMISDLKMMLSDTWGLYNEYLKDDTYFDEKVHAEEIGEKLQGLIDLLERGPFCEPA